ncbi:MAG: hypothetical protein RMK94_08745 [Armatimonadota bacterium]|nr:hypothetical protein [Armatimonadota bacterium]
MALKSQRRIVVQIATVDFRSFQLVVFRALLRTKKLSEGRKLSLIGVRQLDVGVDEIRLIC